MKQIVLGTAGHIDHGKTTLVKALTGTDTDRLKEEKARGITIELGFAHLDLPSGQRLGIVDVPGHEKFVKNMVAGAAGIDLVALVIAADEGVMPQTREHMDICRLLGVSHGLVVLTKVDMVDEEWLDLVTEDVAEYVEGSFLEGAPIVPVSGVSGRGVSELVNILDELVAGIEDAGSGGPFRLPVDRVFSMKGFGTVITGTATGGEIHVGDEVMIYPKGVSSKVRGLQVHNAEETVARRGQRTAINFQGLDKEEIRRGNVVAAPGSHAPSMWLDLEITTLAGNPRPLKHRMPLRFHAGTAEVMGRLILLDRDQFAPGERGYCQVRLEEPLAVMAGDHYVLRSYSPVFTMAGGVVLHPASSRRKRRREGIMADLKTLHLGAPAEKAAVFARERGLAGITAQELVPLLALSGKGLDNLLKELLNTRALVRFDKESGRMVEASVQEEILNAAEGLLAEYHAKNPLKEGMGREELKRRLLPDGGDKLFGHLMKKLGDDGRALSEKEAVRLPGHQVRLEADDAALRGKLEKAYVEGGLTPPTFRELSEGGDANQTREMLRLLVNEGLLLKVNEDLYFHAPAVEGLQTRLQEYFAENEKLGASQFKEMTGLSRKFMIPLLEYFDKTHFTMRVGEERILRKKLGG